MARGDRKNGGGEAPQQPCSSVYATVERGRCPGRSGLIAPSGQLRRPGRVQISSTSSAENVKRRGGYSAR